MVVPAQLAQRKWKTLASVTLAQCILESAWGQSQLARRANNYFGVKALPNAAYMEFSTREVVTGRSVMELAKFAKYPSAIESFDAHAKLLATLSRYQPCMRAAALGNAHSVCVQLQLDGYSTNPDYAAQLTALIQQHNLTQYDLTPLPEAPAAQPNQEAA